MLDAKPKDLEVAFRVPAKKVPALFTRRKRWGLSWFGWLVAVGAMGALGIGVCVNIYPFLAETQRVQTDILVVEGWVHDYAIRAAVEEFQEGKYEEVFTTGGPVEGSGEYINDANTSANVGAELLVHNGLPTTVVHSIPSRVIDRDRTYGAAVALRDWFNEHNLHIKSINVLTENTHARRTKLLFHEALESKVLIGIIAVPHPDYDPHRWWRYSEGVKEVFSEGIAYSYVKFFFWPGKSMGASR